MSLKSPLITVMTRAAMKASRHLKRDFGEVENLQVSRKGPADFVSTADLKAEKILREELERARPHFGFLLEEAGSIAGKEGEQRRWIVDPLDGTSNFLHGLPHFAISLALEERGDVLAAVILDPIKDELFTAEKGQGAFLNDRRIRVSGRRRMDEALFATGIPFKGKTGHRAFLDELEQVMAVSAGVRRWGTASLDLAYVAAGRYEGFDERLIEIAGDLGTIGKDDVTPRIHKGDVALRDDHVPRGMVNNLVRAQHALPVGHFHVAACRDGPCLFIVQHGIG